MALLNATAGVRRDQATNRNCTVGYFDWPITDNTKLGEYRVSVGLVSSNGHDANIRIVAYPKDLANDRFDIKELARSLQETQTPG